MNAQLQSFGKKLLEPNAALWIAGVVGFVAAWFVVYEQLVPFSSWAVALSPCARKPCL